MELTCERCGGTWTQKGEEEPKTCARCNSPFWKKPLTPYWKEIREKNEKRKLGTDM